MSRDRLGGYLDTLVSGGVNADNVPVWEASGSRRELGREGGRWILSRRPRPTAVLCASDELAFGVLQATRDLGLAVPDDVSVVGFDDVLSAQHTEPPLTTVRQPLAKKGRGASGLALELLAGERDREPVRLAVELISRASRAPKK